MSRREVVARLHTPPMADGTPAQSWIVPISVGRHYRRTWLGARWMAWRWTRRDARRDRVSDGPLRMTWEVRP